MHTEFWWGNLKERDHLEDPRVDGIPIKCIYKKYDIGWIGLIWLMILAGGKLLHTH